MPPRAPPEKSGRNRISLVEDVELAVDRFVTGMPCRLGREHVIIRVA
jgi:hypothetical protein